MRRIYHARLNAALCAILAAAIALLLTARGADWPPWLMGVAMLGAANVTAALTYGLTMTGLRGPIRAHGGWAAFAALVSSGFAFAGAWTAGEPALLVAVAMVIAGAGTFLAVLVVMGAGGAK